MQTGSSPERSHIMPDPFFRIEMLAAIQGDALWIEYGNANDKNRILIDGGPIGAYAALDT